MRLRLLPAAALVMVLFATGCSSTPAKPAPAAGTTVHLTDYTDNDGPISDVILAGAIGDFGTAQRVEAGLELKLARGSFRLNLGALHDEFVRAMATLAVDTTTCSATASVSGAVPIAAGSGTGSYNGISGTFNLTMTLDEVYKPGACDGTSAYLAQTIITTGPGTVSLH